MDFNFATTVSFSAATTCLAFSVLGLYLGRGSASRHFRFAAAAGFAASTFCVTDAVVAGGVAVGPTVFAGRLTMLAVALHGAAWLAFLAAWAQRPLTRFERLLIVTNVALGLASLVPGVAAFDSVTPRTLGWLSVTYNDPDPTPFAPFALALAWVTHVFVVVVAYRTSRTHPRARIVAAALGLFSLVIPLDCLSGMHLVDLPYLSDPALVILFLAIGSVVMIDAAESAAKSAELERTRAAFAERENLAALGQLAAVVAHEVRNPVAIIFGALANLRRAERSAEDAELLGIVGEEAERLKQLVARLLDAVRPFELQYTRRDVGQVVRSAIAQVTAGAGVPPSQVALGAAPAHEVECDEVLLGQAISNLVQNALVATGRRSPVRVLASVEPASEPETLRIEIADDGDGVPPEAEPRLFTPFFTTRATGTGLGLALVKRIAGAHGGTVDFERGSAGGASFVLRVPLRAREDATVTFAASP